MSRRPRAACRRLAVAALCAAASACGMVANLSRPGGDGGWSAARREQELARRAATAGVEFASSGAPAPAPNGEAPAISGPLDLATALTLAATRNRRIAEAAQQLEIARENFVDARGR